MTDGTLVDEPAPQARPGMGDRLRTPAGRVTVIVLVLTVVLLIFGVWWVSVSLPTTASNTMKAVKDTMLVFSIAAAPVMALVWGVAYFSLRQKRHSGDEPPEDGPPIRGNNRVVLSWVLVSSLLTLFLLIWGLAELTATSATADSPLVVEVTGQQWVWSFKYPDNGGVSTADLVLPADRPVLFKVTSTDVIHSFWLPEMGIKVDANPGIETDTATTPTLLGTFNVRCAELCGLNHSYMQTTVDVVPSADFDTWVQSNGGTVQ